MGHGGHASNLGVLATAQGKWEEAEDLFETSLALRGAMGDMEGVAILHNNLGTVVRNEGRALPGRQALSR